MARVRGILILTLILLLPTLALAENGKPDRRRETDPKLLQEQLRRTADRIAVATVRVDTPEGMGSGTILDLEGHILTSAHVVEDASSVTVTLNDGRRYEARVLGINGAGDLALLDIDAEGLHPIELGDSDKISPSQWVVAAGHPVSAFDDFQPTISLGMVRRVDGVIRADRRKVFYSAIVSDVPLSPGSSGGGLYDIDGRLIAVNAAVTRDERGAFSVRISEYKQDAGRLLDGERFDRRAERLRSAPEDETEGPNRRNDWFASQFGGKGKQLGRRQVELSRGRESFSGIVVSPAGEILAPARFLGDLEPGDMIAGFVGDEEVLVSYVGSDLTNGVALLRLPEGEPRDHFDLARAAAREPCRGDLALALRGEQVVGGIVAAARRVPPLVLTDEVYYPNVIQVDLRLFRSERGAPVLDIEGGLLGMVVQHRLLERRAAASPYGAFLLPPSLLLESHRLIARGEGRGERPVGFLGVMLEDMTESAKAGLALEEGVEVVLVERGMPAWRAGIRRGDVILAIGGTKVGSRGEAIGRIAGYRRGDRVRVALRRANQSLDVEVEMAQRSDVD
ncbi:MAG: trypsin-like peptidase domain-containing protein [Planctomycetes bacterium]|nr:trypsin-like peptidase domain-containing protein [Planctomycetota bacterium]